LIPVAFFTAAPIRLIEFGGDVVRTTSMSSARTIARLVAQPVDAFERVQLLRGDPAPRSVVADSVHPGLCRRRRLVVAVHPLRIVGGEHVRLDAEARQVRRELQRALHTTSAGRRKVHRHEQDLHRSR
jgi:hypothetical protein